MDDGLAAGMARTVHLARAIARGEGSADLDWYERDANDPRAGRCAATRHHVPEPGVIRCALIAEDASGFVGESLRVDLSLASPDPRHQVIVASLHALGRVTSAVRVGGEILVDIVLHQIYLHDYAGIHEISTRDVVPGCDTSQSVDFGGVLEDRLLDLVMQAELGLIPSVTWRPRRCIGHGDGAVALQPLVVVLRDDASGLVLLVHEGGSDAGRTLWLPTMRLAALSDSARRPAGSVG